MKESYLQTMTRELSAVFSPEVSTGFPPLIAVLLLAAAVGNTIILCWMRHDNFIRTGRRFNWASMLVLFIVGILVLPVYLERRTPGRIVLCLHCGNSMLKDSHVCNYCGREDAEGSLSDWHVAHT